VTAEGAGPLSEFDLPLEQLREYRPAVRCPEDFDAFWQRTLDRASGVPLEPRLRPEPSALTTVDVHDLSFAGFDGDRINGWLLHPRDLVVPRACVVQFIGYGDGRGNPLEHLTWASLGFVHLVIETRGQGSASRAGVTRDPHVPDPHAPGFLTRGIRDPEDYYYRRVYVDAARAVAVAADHPLVDPDRIAVIGTSQGGGIALAAAALSGRVAAVVANLPFGCHFDRAVRVTDQGPYVEVADYLRVFRDEVDRALTTLAYFDVVHFARRSHAPALFSAALMDRVCPPSTVFAAYNTYAGPRTMQVWPFNGHEGGGTDQLDHDVRFLARTLAAAAEDGALSHGVG
jgi:cephalosporin-C deacetylase